MAEQWIIRVQDKEYGPADLSTLQEWKTEGRVLASNDAREEDSDTWTKAAGIPGLFESAVPPVQTVETARSTPPRTSLFGLLGNTLAVYRRGFFQFLCLTLLVTVPPLCGEFTENFIRSANVDADVRALAQFGFGFCMTALLLLLWPVYVAGIQILTAELAGGDRISFLRVLSAAVRFWPRVAGLCVIVYAVFLALIGFALGIAALIAAGSESLGTVFSALFLLVLQIWLFSRWFALTLFWEQTAVLGNASAGNALRLSNKLARSRRDLPWYQRPLWRGAFIVSLWVVFLLALYWPLVRQAFDQSSQLLGTGGDLQSILDSLKNQSQNQTATTTTRDLALWLIQKLFQPLLGIAFVLLFLDCRDDIAP